MSQLKFWGNPNFSASKPNTRAGISFVILWSLECLPRYRAAVGVVPRGLRRGGRAGHRQQAVRHQDRLQRSSQKPVAYVWAECATRGSGEAGQPLTLFPPPPTAFSPESARRRVTAMKQILLMIAVVGMVKRRQPQKLKSPRRPAVQLDCIPAHPSGRPSA